MVMIKSLHKKVGDNMTDMESKLSKYVSNFCLIEKLRQVLFSVDIEPIDVPPDWDIIKEIFEDEERRKYTIEEKLIYNTIVSLESENDKIIKDLFNDRQFAFYFKHQMENFFVINDGKGEYRLLPGCQCYEPYEFEMNEKDTFKLIKKSSKRILEEEKKSKRIFKVVK